MSKDIRYGFCNLTAIGLAVLFLVMAGGAWAQENVTLKIAVDGVKLTESSTDFKLKLTTGDYAEAVGTAADDGGADGYSLVDFGNVEAGTYDILCNDARTGAVLAVSEAGITETGDSAVRDFFKITAGTVVGLRDGLDVVDMEYTVAAKSIGVDFDEVAGSGYVVAGGGVLKITPAIASNLSAARVIDYSGTSNYNISKVNSGIYTETVTEALEIGLEVWHTYTVNLTLRLDGENPGNATIARRFAFAGHAYVNSGVGQNVWYNASTGVLTVTGIEEDEDGGDFVPKAYPITYEGEATGASVTVGWDESRNNGVTNLTSLNFYTLRVSKHEGAEPGDITGSYTPSPTASSVAVLFDETKLVRPAGYVVAGGGHLTVNVAAPSVGMGDADAIRYDWSNAPSAGSNVTVKPALNDLTDGDLTSELRWVGTAGLNAPVNATVAAAPLYNVTLEGLTLDNTAPLTQADAGKFTLRTVGDPGATVPVPSVTYSNGVWDGTDMVFALLPVEDYEVLYSDAYTGTGFEVTDMAGNGITGSSRFLTVRFSDSLKAGSPAPVSWDRVTGLYTSDGCFEKAGTCAGYAVDTFTVASGRVVFANNTDVAGSGTLLRLSVSDPKIDENVVTGFTYLWSNEVQGGGANYLSGVTDALPAAITLDGAKAINARCVLTPLYRVTLKINKNNAPDVFDQVGNAYCLGAAVSPAVTAGEESLDGVVTFDNVSLVNDSVEVFRVTGSVGAFIHNSTGIKVMATPAVREFALNYFEVDFAFDTDYCLGSGTGAGQCGNTDRLEIHTGYGASGSVISVSKGNAATASPLLAVPGRDIKVEVANASGADKKNMFVYDWAFGGIAKSAVTTTASSVEVHDSVRITAAELAGAVDAIVVTITPRKIADAVVAVSDDIWDVIRGTNPSDKVGVGVSARYQVDGGRLNLPMTRQAFAALAGLPASALSGQVSWSVSPAFTNSGAIVTASGATQGNVTLPAFGSVSEGTLRLNALLAGSGSVEVLFPVTILPTPALPQEAVDAVAKVFVNPTAALNTTGSYTAAQVGPYGWDHLVRSRNGVYTTNTQNGLSNVTLNLNLPANVAQVRAALEAVTDPAPSAALAAASLTSLIGVENIMITWSSDKPAVINPSTGAVTRPSFGEEPQVVSLTAAISAAGAADNRSVTFTLTVRPYADENDQAVTELANLLTWSAIRGNIANTNTSESSVTRDLVLPVNGMFPAAAADRVEGVKITWALTGSGGAAAAMVLGANPKDIDDATGPIALAVVRPVSGSPVSRALTATLELGNVAQKVSFGLTVPVKGEIRENHISLNNTSVVYNGEGQRISDAVFASGAWNTYAVGGGVDTVYTYTGIAPTTGYFVYSRKAGAAELGASSALPVEAGAYSVKVTFENRDFIGASAARTLTVQRALLTADMLEVFAEELVYDGFAHEPYYEVKFDEATPLTLDTHYRGGYGSGAARTAYNNTLNAGNEARVGIEGIGNYRGEVMKTFSVAKRPITFDMTGSGVSAGKVYDGTDDVAASLIAVAFNGLAGSESLVRGTDYTVSGKYSGANAGAVSAAVTVELQNTVAANNYVLAVPAFTVDGLAITGKTLVLADLEIEATAVYNAAAQPVVIGGIVNPDGLTVTYDGEEEAPVNAGKYEVKVDIAAGGNYNAAVFTFDYTIMKKEPDVADLIFDSFDQVQYGDSVEHFIDVAVKGTGYGTVTVLYNGEEAPPVELGEYVVAVKISGGDNYTAGTVTLGTLKVVEEVVISVAGSDKSIPGAKSEEAVIVAPKALSAMFTAGPNPVSRSAGSVKLFWQGKEIMGGSLSIFDANGNLVSKVSLSDKGASTDRREVGSWSLRDSKGRSVSEGTYLIRGVIVGRDGSKSRVACKIGVR